MVKNSSFRAQLRQKCWQFSMSIHLSLTVNLNSIFALQADGVFASLLSNHFQLQ